MLRVIFILFAGPTPTRSRRRPCEDGSMDGSWARVELGTKTKETDWARGRSQASCTVNQTSSIVQKVLACTLGYGLFCNARRGH
jgi:hypothetical protein